METQAPALPVPPLPEEQKDQLKPWAEQALADRDSDGNPALARLLACGVPEIVLHYEALIANYKRREASGADTWLVTKQFITDQGNELSASKSEVARLSRLLEEERRTVAGLKQELASQEVEKLDLVKENASQGRRLHAALSALAGMWNQYCPPAPADAEYRAPGHMFMSAGEEAEDILCLEGMMRPNETAIDPDFEFEELPAAIKALARPAAPTCQRDCQKCESRSVIDQSPEIIGFYETSGLPVREGDDYVTDVEGCYLTRAEANELAEEAASTGVGLQGEEGGGNA